MKKSLASLLLLIFALNLFASDEVQDSLQLARYNVLMQLQIYPQEKIYLQTDKPYYISGEKMYFRVYLLNASVNSPINLSRFVYVEMIDATSKVVVRQQIRVTEDKLFYGFLNIPESLPEGNYRLRAYTRYLENIGEDWFYASSVFIADPNASKVEIETNYDFSVKNKPSVSLKFKNDKGYIHPEKVDFLFNNSMQTAEKNAEGSYNALFSLNDTIKNRVLLVTYHDHSNTFSKYIPIPYPENSPEIVFFPEGGNFVADRNNRVAFKVFFPNGKSSDFSGAIYDSENKLITNIATQHEGMGSFSITPQKNESYYAQLSCNNKIYKTKLPVAGNLYAIHTQWKNDSLVISTISQPNMIAEKHYLLVHRTGSLVYFEEWNNNQNKLMLNRDMFDTGVYHVLLVNHRFEPVSERLVFNYKETQLPLSVSLNKNRYRPRENIKVTIQYADSVAASLAISVTDDKDVKLGTASNLSTEINLVSELKGQINNPAYYFDSDKNVIEHADLLMLTHGWRRYNVEEALIGNLQQPIILPEISQSFTGSVKKKSGRPETKATVRMSALGSGFSEENAVDESGRYAFMHFEFPDSMSFFFIANTQKDKLEGLKAVDVYNTVQIYPDEISYPVVGMPWKYFETTTVPHNYLQEYAVKANNKYMQENGFRTIHLKEIEVSTNKTKGKEPVNTAVVGSDYRFAGDEVQTAISFEDLFIRLPGAVIQDNTVLIRNVASQFVLDGVALEHVTLSELNMFVNIAEIEQIDLIRDVVQTRIYSSSGNPIIYLTSKSAGVESALNRSYTKTIMPLGYQLPVEFYSPRYDNKQAMRDPKPDLRSTLFWKPNIQLNKKGNGEIDFYAADSSTSYSVVIEGIGLNRKLIHYKSENAISVQK